jgi:hypothetical protein
MSRHATKCINRAFWRQIDEAQQRSGSAERVPVLVWDYNVSAAEIYSHLASHRQLWDDLVAWGVLKKMKGSSGEAKFIDTRKARFPRQYYRVKQAE